MFRKTLSSFNTTTFPVLTTTVFASNPFVLSSTARLFHKAPTLLGCSSDGHFQDTFNAVLSNKAGGPDYPRRYDSDAQTSSSYYSYTKPSFSANAEPRAPQPEQKQTPPQPAIDYELRACEYGSILSQIVDKIDPNILHSALPSKVITRIDKALVEHRAHRIDDIKQKITIAEAKLRKQEERIRDHEDEIKKMQLSLDNLVEKDDVLSNQEKLWGSKTSQQAQEELDIIKNQRVYLGANITKLRSEIKSWNVYLSNDKDLHSTINNELSTLKNMSPDSIHFLDQECDPQLTTSKRRP
jgi:hypothetical protein